MEFIAPFQRVIQKEEMWQYKYPKTGDYVSARWLFGFIIPFPMVMLTLIYLFKRDKADFMAANLAYSLAVGLNGFITDCMKITVGRPRPDYYWRCFPDGQYNEAMNCTNTNHRDVIQGRKSFPSGHASCEFVYIIPVLSLHFLNKCFFLQLPFSHLASSRFISWENSKYSMKMAVVQELVYHSV